MPYPKYKTVHINYIPFYIFSLGGKKSGSLPAGLSVRVRNKKGEYRTCTTADLLGSIYTFWQQNHRLPQTLIKKEQPMQWFKKDGAFDEISFGKLCHETKI